MSGKRPRLEWSDGAAGPLLAAEAAIRAFFGDEGHEPGALGWMSRGRCAEVDPEIFFPEKGSAGIRDAKAVCRRCPVQQRCLEYAVDNQIQHGVWGGLTLVERRRLRQSPGQEAA